MTNLQNHPTNEALGQATKDFFITVKHGAIACFWKSDDHWAWVCALASVILAAEFPAYWAISQDVGVETSSAAGVIIDALGGYTMYMYLCHGLPQATIWERARRIKKRRTRI